jgi:two-component system OmpR family response regulator
VKKTALIVDDEIEICQLLVSYLKRKKIDSFYALTLGDALAKAEKQKPDIIFLDNNLPDGSGISHILEFKKINSTTKIIIISARTNLEESAIESGATGFLSKPISYQNIDSYIK